MAGSQARSSRHRCISIAVDSNPRAFLRSQTQWSTIYWVMNEARALRLWYRYSKTVSFRRMQPQVPVRGVAHSGGCLRQVLCSFMMLRPMTISPYQRFGVTPSQQKSAVWTLGPSGEFWTVCRFSPSRPSPPTASPSPRNTGLHSTGRS